MAKTDPSLIDNQTSWFSSSHCNLCRFPLPFRGCVFADVWKSLPTFYESTIETFTNIQFDHKQLPTGGIYSLRYNQWSVIIALDAISVTWPQYTSRNFVRHQQYIQSMEIYRVRRCSSGRDLDLDGGGPIYNKGRRLLHGGCRISHSKCNAQKLLMTHQIKIDITTSHLSLIHVISLLLN